MRKKEKYIEYDYEGMFVSQTNLLNEWMIEQMIKNRHARVIYATKEFKMRENLDIEIYPEFTKKEMEEYKAKKVNKKAKNKLNDSNSRKHITRLINKNFGDGDVWATFGYDPKYLPNNIDKAQTDMGNYIRRVNYRLKKMGKEKAKYVYITEYSKKEDIRFHHHLIIKCDLSMDELEEMWKYGRRNHLRKIERDEYGIVGLGRYISKAKKTVKYEKRWRSSKNLEKVTYKKNHYKFKRRKVEEMVRNNNIIQEYMEKTYTEYRFLDAETKYNEINGMWYISARMRKRI